MSDNEIIKALECCKTTTVFDCNTCPYKGIGKGLVGCTNLLLGDALDLINRQKAEIKSLADHNKKLRYDVKKIRAEAIEECAVRIIEEFIPVVCIEIKRGILDLVKEMIGEEK